VTIAQLLNAVPFVNCRVLHHRCDAMWLCLIIVTIAQLLNPVTFVNCRVLHHRSDAMWLCLIIVTWHFSFSSQLLDPVTFVNSVAGDRRCLFIITEDPSPRDIASHMRAGEQTEQY